MIVRQMRVTARRGPDRCGEAEMSGMDAGFEN